MAQIFIVSFTIVDVTSQSVKMTNAKKGCIGMTRKFRVGVELGGGGEH